MKDRRPHHLTAPGLPFLRALTLRPNSYHFLPSDDDNPVGVIGWWFFGFEASGLKNLNSCGSVQGIKCQQFFRQM